MFARFFTRVVLRQDILGEIFEDILELGYFKEKRGVSKDHFKKTLSQSGPGEVISDFKRLKSCDSKNTSIDMEVKIIRRFL